MDDWRSLKRPNHYLLHYDKQGQTCLVKTTFFASHPKNAAILSCLKTLDTIGNCQRPVFSLRVSQHMHKIICIMSHKVLCFQMLDFETSNSISEVSKSNSWKIISFSKTTSLQRKPFLTTFYYINLSPLPSKFYANNYFEYLPIVSTAFKDTSVTTATRTHTLLNRNTRAWVRCSYPLSNEMPHMCVNISVSKMCSYKQSNLYRIPYSC